MRLQRVAVTGATGRIGAPLVRALIEAGVSVRALSRRPPLTSSVVEWVQGDLLEGSGLAELVRDVDTVFHAGGLLEGDPRAVYRSLTEGTARVLAAAASVRLVHLSSMVVLDTASPAAVIGVGSPLEPSPARRGVYTRAKAVAEALVRTASIHQDVVIVRPGLVLAEGRNAMPASVAIRVGPLWVPVGPDSAQLPVVSAAGVAAGLITAARDAESGAVVHLVDQPPMTRRELFDRLRDTAPPGLRLPIGSLVLALALGSTKFSGLAYRIASAARPHRWLPS